MDNKGIICAMYQSHNGMHPQSKLIVWNKEPNVRYRPKTIHGHIIKAEDVRDTMHSISTQKEHLKKFIILCQRTSGKGEDVKCIL